MKARPLHKRAPTSDANGGMHAGGENVGGCAIKCGGLDNRGKKRRSGGGMRREAQ